MDKGGRLYLSQKSFRRAYLFTKIWKLSV